MSEYTNYFLDTEFIERGHEHPIELLSVGLVCEDGRTFYAENYEAEWDHANDWVKENVLGYLDPEQFGLNRSYIAEGILEFVAAGANKPRFWCYYGDYDWVVFCQLFGTMVDLPEGWPMFAWDLKQWAVMQGDPPLPEQEGDEHHALADAKWNMQVYRFLDEFDNYTHRMYYAEKK